MDECVSQTDSRQAAPTLAKSLAPEDVRVGDFVTPLHETYDYPSFVWDCDTALAERSETVPIRFVACGSGAPLKVKAVCLPFVLVKHPSRGTYPLDIRRHQLARLDQAYADAAWKSMKRREKPRPKKTRRKKK